MEYYTITHVRIKSINIHTAPCHVHVAYKLVRSPLYIMASWQHDEESRCDTIVTIEVHKFTLLNKRKGSRQRNVFI